MNTFLNKSFLHIALILSIVLTAVIGPVGANSRESAFTALARNMADSLNAKDFPGFCRDFDDNLRKALPLDKIEPFCTNILSSFGKVKDLDKPNIQSPVLAVIPLCFEASKLDLKIVLGQAGKIAGFSITAHVPPIPVPERHETVLRLPMTGKWFTFWGGDTAELNRHHSVPNQKYGFDFVVVDEKGSSHSGDGKVNEDYYAFGKEVTAPADGLVTDVITGVADNVPGSMNGFSALGNAVFIRHKEHEVSILAHFKADSIRVKPGDRVKAGQVLGLCGNSGNSSEAHIHYHLQNTNVIQDGTCLKCHFSGMTIIRQGKVLDSADAAKDSPIRGDIIENR